jgi:hypothetical protein
MASHGAGARVLADSGLCLALLRAAPDAATVRAAACACRALAAAARAPGIWARFTAALAPHVAASGRNACGAARLRAYAAAARAAGYAAPSLNDLSLLTFVLHLRRGASGASSDSEEEDEEEEEEEEEAQPADEAGALLFCGVATPALEEEDDDDDDAPPRRHQPRRLGAITFSGAFTAAVASRGFLGTDTATLFVERRNKATGEVRVACLFADAPRTRKVYFYYHSRNGEAEPMSDDAEWVLHDATPEQELRHFRQPDVHAFVPPFAHISFMSGTLPPVCVEVVDFSELRAPSWCTVECALSHDEERGSGDDATTTLNATLAFRCGRDDIGEEYGGAESGGDPVSATQLLRALTSLNWR